MAYNSTIIQKKKICIRCGKPCFWFSRKRCQDCARIEDTMSRMEAVAEKEIEEEGLSELIHTADELFSKWIRMSNMDSSGMVKCFTCDTSLRWQEAQCGHYIKRGNLFLRFDPRNARVQDKACNEFKGGNYIEFTRRLEAERPGITEILMEESRLVYKPTRQEIKNLIQEYSKKIRMIES